MDGLSDEADSGVVAQRQRQFQDNLAAASGTAVAPAGGGGKGGNGPPSQDITMSAIEGMFKQNLQPLQQGVAAIKAHGVSRDELKESLDPIKHDVQMLTARIDSVEQAGFK